MSADFKGTLADQNTQTEPEGIETVPCTVSVIDEMKRISDRIFPIIYHQDFYEKLFSNTTEVYLVKNRTQNIGIFAVRIIKPAFPWIFGKNDGVTKDVCSICKKRKDTTKEALEKRFVYIIIIGLLPDERSKGYGGVMIRKIEEITSKHGMEHIVLHVQASNVQAMSFYYRIGFKLVAHVKDYYCNIEPKDALLLRKCLYQQ